MFLRGNYLIVVLTLCQSSSNVIPKLPALEGGGSLNNPQSVANTGTQSQPHPPPIPDNRQRSMSWSSFSDRLLLRAYTWRTQGHGNDQLAETQVAEHTRSSHLIGWISDCQALHLYALFCEIYLKQRYFWLICNVRIVPGSAEWGSCWSMTVHCLCSTDPHHRPPDGSKCSTKTCQTVKIICLFNHV